jgi:nicotinamidase-related amidase
MTRHSFARADWGSEWYPDLAPRPGDITAEEHWAQDGLASVGVDSQLRLRGITRVIIVGALAHTCIGSASSYAMELGYHVTPVRDAATAVPKEMMHAVHQLIRPVLFYAILTSAEMLARLPGTAAKG